MVEHFLQDGKLWLFLKAINRKELSQSLLLQKVDPLSLKPIDEPRLISTAKGSTNRLLHHVDFLFHQNLSASYMAVVAIWQFGSIKSEMQQISIDVLDSDMNSAWSIDAEIPYKDYLFEIEQIRVDEQGNVYLLGFKYKGDQRTLKKNGLPNYEYHVLKFKRGSTDTEDYTIALDEEFITDMTIDVLDNQDIIAGGFYSLKRQNAIHGTYFLTIDAESKIVRSKAQKAFTEDFLTQSLKEKEQERISKKIEKGKDVELYNYYLDDIIRRDDGGAVLVAEQYREYTSTRTNVGTGTTSGTGIPTTSTVRHYVYDDIIVVSLSPEGIIEWATKIPKRQDTREDRGQYSSYLYAIANNKLYFIYNDNPSNLSLKKEGRYSNYIPGINSICMLVSLDVNGELEKESLFMVGETQVIPKLKNSRQIDENSVLLYGTLRKEQRLIRLDFKPQD